MWPPVVLLRSHEGSLVRQTISFTLDKVKMNSSSLPHPLHHRTLLPPIPSVSICLVVVVVSLLLFLGCACSRCDQVLLGFVYLRCSFFALFSSTSSQTKEVLKSRVNTFAVNQNGIQIEAFKSVVNTFAVNQNSIQTEKACCI